MLGPELAATAADLARIRGRLAAMYPIARAEQTLASLRGALADRIARGEGTIGRLLSDPELLRTVQPPVWIQ